MAASDSKAIPVKNAALRITFPIFDADGDLVTGAAGLDSEISIDAGAFADCTNEATEIATASGMYYLDLTAAEMNGDTIAIIVKTSTVGAKTTPLVLYTAARSINDLATATALATVQSDTDDMQTRLPAALVSGRMDSSVGAMGAGVVTAAAIATDAVDADALAADAVAEIQSGQATSAAVAGIQADTDDIQSRLPAALVGGRMDASVGAVAAGAIAGASFAVGAFDAIFTRALSAVEGAANSRSLAWALSKLTNRVFVSGSTLHVKKTDDATDMFTQTLTTDASQPPVVGIDTD